MFEKVRSCVQEFLFESDLDEERSLSVFLSQAHIHFALLPAPAFSRYLEEIKD